jgi:four helix bundle protein
MTKEVPNLNDEVVLVAEENPGEEAFWAKSGLLLNDGEASSKPVFDLEERTARFGEAVIRFAKRIPRSPVNDRLIGQLVGAATSVGANYAEADDGVSRQDFRHRIGICRKEAREAKHFLRMIAVAEESLKPEARVLWQEAKELHLIFCTIWRNSA